MGDGVITRRYFIRRKDADIYTERGRNTPHSTPNETRKLQDDKSEKVAVYEMRCSSIHGIVLILPSKVRLLTFFRFVLIIKMKKKKKIKEDESVCGRRVVNSQISLSSCK